MENKNNNSQNRIAKESMFIALMILMEQKSFKEISITELTKKAGVSRMAFYRNYNQMEDIIISYLNEFFDEFSKQILSREEFTNIECLSLCFTHFRKQEKLITNLINSNLTNLLLESCAEFFHSLSKHIVSTKPCTCSPEIIRYHIEFVAGGLYKVLIEWAKSGMKENDEAMAKIICNIVSNLMIE